MATFKVMTWNVENLLTPSPGDADELHVFQQKLLVLSTIINQEHPDVVALQEVGGEGPLVELQDALGGTYPHRAISVFPDQRGIRVCFLWTAPGTHGWTSDRWDRAGEP